MLFIKIDGTVDKVTVRSGNEALAQAAVRAVRKCRFTPATYEGKPVFVKMPRRYVFKIEQ